MFVKENVWKKIIGLKMFSFIVDEFVEKNKVNLKSVVVI